MGRLADVAGPGVDCGRCVAENLLDGEVMTREKVEELTYTLIRLYLFGRDGVPPAPLSAMDIGVVERASWVEYRNDPQCYYAVRTTLARLLEMRND